MAGFLAKLFKTNRKEFEEQLKSYLMDDELSYVHPYPWDK